VRFLVDAQLPPLLARHLINSNHQAEHVSDVGLSTARDRDIWEYALTNGAVLITKDEDFVTMRAFNANGPAIVWIRLGNTTRHELLTRFSAIQTSIFAALERGETIVEISSPPDA
jgi:predicted nuclease of predicted toxin-antitoxin system